MKPSSYPNNPKLIWDIFYDITRCPRPSKNEAAIIDYITSIASNNNCSYTLDKASNILIKVKGTRNRESEPPVLIQNHIDMVCDKFPEIKHDFNKDPIPLKVDGEWLTTEGTTLGADNGLGVAAALALIIDKSIEHPPLELLFTTDEETGLNGALNLETENITAKRFINLDSEMWGELTIGCAGGKEVLLTKRFTLNENTIKQDSNYLSIELSGLRGGHSGIDIHLQQGNAIVLLADFLSRCDQEHISLIQFEGGKAHNIIPRTAKAVVNVPDHYVKELKKLLQDYIKKVSPSLHKEDLLKGKVENTVNNVGDYPITMECMKLFCHYILTIPHGAHKYDHDSPTKLVRLSSNIAKVSVINGQFTCLNSYRFMDQSDQFNFENKYLNISKLHNINCEMDEGYPNWKPVYDGQLLKLVKDIYNQEFGIKPIVSAMHAGLECGIVSEKIGRPMDIISFGPTILAAHTPKERVQIKSVEKFWKLLKEVLKQLH